MSKQLLIAAFPAAAMKFCLMDGNNVTEELSSWQPDAVKALNYFVSKNKDIEKITILGPIDFTGHIKENFTMNDFSYLPPIELREK